MSDENLRQVLAQNIKRRRKELGITQARLAEYADISETHMNSLERSETWIGETTFQKIAEALHTKPYKLLIPQEENTHTNAVSLDKINSKTYSVIHTSKQELYKHIDTTVELAIRQITALYESDESEKAEYYRAEKAREAKKAKPPKQHKKRNK